MPPPSPTGPAAHATGSSTICRTRPPPPAATPRLRPAGRAVVDELHALRGRAGGGPGWPARRLLPALRLVATDQATRSPLRVAEAGPWWKDAQDDGGDSSEELAALEARLDALDDRRRALQRQARADLQAQGLPLTRTTVLRRAAALTDVPVTPPALPPLHRKPPPARPALPSRHQPAPDATPPPPRQPTSPASRQHPQMIATPTDPPSTAAAAPTPGGLATHPAKEQS